MRISALNTSCNPLWPSQDRRGIQEVHVRLCYAGQVCWASRRSLPWQVCRLATRPTPPRTGSPPPFRGRTSWLRRIEYQWKVTIAVLEGVRQPTARSAASSRSPSRSSRAPWFGRLRPCSSCASATDPMLGINLDPSHMMVLGADPIAAARALKGCIYPRSRQGRAYRARSG